MGLEKHNKSVLVRMRSKQRDRLRECVRKVRFVSESEFIRQAINEKIDRLEKDDMGNE